MLHKPAQTAYQSICFKKNKNVNHIYAIIYAKRKTMNYVGKLHMYVQNGHHHLYLSKCQTIYQP